MRRAVLAVLLLGLVVMAFLAFPRESQKEGELLFSPENIDLGQVPLGQTAPGRFVMRNVGDKPVRVVKPQIKAVEGC